MDSLPIIPMEGVCWLLLFRLLGDHDSGMNAREPTGLQLQACQFGKAIPFRAGGGSILQGQ